MGIFDKFRIGFKKSASAFTSGLKEIIVKKEINDENLNKIEDYCKTWHFRLFSSLLEKLY